MTTELNKKEETMLTVVFDRSGEEICRFDGQREIDAKQYKLQLPITVVYLKLTSEVVAIHKIQSITQK